MTRFSAEDRAYMADALRLAERGRYGAHPNPMVGCVLVRDGEVIGRGWHERSGEAHAEVNALTEAGAAAKGATAYVTLEPCSHHGKTAPCAEALVAAGVGRVVAAMRDPFPTVSGSGFDRLAEQGIDVSFGLFEAEARVLNAGFLARVERGFPRVTLKLAASLDGATAMASGESQWITGAAARLDVQRLRARSGAIMTGVDTVISDDPSLNVRSGDGYVQPSRVILDSTLRLPPSARLLSLPGETLVYCRADVAPRQIPGARVVSVATDNRRVSLPAVLADLAKRQVNDVLIEAGATLAGAALRAGVVDQVVIYQAPHMMGSETRPLLRTPGLLELGSRYELAIEDLRRIGADLRIVATPATAKSG